MSWGEVCLLAGLFTLIGGLLLVSFDLLTGYAVSAEGVALGVSIFGVVGVAMSAASIPTIGFGVLLTAVGVRV